MQLDIEILEDMGYDVLPYLREFPPSGARQERWKERIDLLLPECLDLLKTGMNHEIDKE